jgi:hypothetical protein
MQDEVVTPGLHSGVLNSNLSQDIGYFKWQLSSFPQFIQATNIWWKKDVYINPYCDCVSKPKQ